MKYTIILMFLSALLFQCNDKIKEPVDPKAGNCKVVNYFTNLSNKTNVKVDELNISDSMLYYATSTKYTYDNKNQVKGIYFYTEYNDFIGKANVIRDEKQRIIKVSFTLLDTNAISLVRNYFYLGSGLLDRIETYFNVFANPYKGQIEYFKYNSVNQLIQIERFDKLPFKDEFQKTSSKKIYYDNKGNVASDTTYQNTPGYGLYVNMVGVYSYDDKEYYGKKFFDFDFPENKIYYKNNLINKEEYYSILNYLPLDSVTFWENPIMVPSVSYKYTYNYNSDNVLESFQFTSFTTSTIEGVGLEKGKKYIIENQKSGTSRFSTYCP